MVMRALRAGLLAVALAALVSASGRHRVFAWSASAPLLPNGSAQGTGFASTTTDVNETVSISLQGARPNATYAIFACVGLISGDFNCTNHNLPSTVQQVVVAPKGIAPVVVTLVQQGTMTVDANGNGSTLLALQQGLYPNTVHSIYNVVQLIDTADGTDSYTALDLQAPTLPVQGVNPIFPGGIALVLGVPVYVFAQFPGYVFPVAITTISGYPFFPFYSVPIGFFGSPFPLTVGTCPNGLPPHVVSGPFGGLAFSC